MVGKIIDNHIVTGQFEGLGLKIGLLIAIYIGLSLAMYFQNYWMVGIAQQTVYRLRTNLFAHLQKLPVTFFDKRQHGELMSRVTNDIENVSQTLNTSFHSSVFKYSDIDRNSCGHAVFKSVVNAINDDYYSSYVYRDSLDYAPNR